MTNVLIAEDDLFVADMLENVLVEGGYDVCGIARTVQEGIALTQLHQPDLAVLDLRLAEGGLGTDIAARFNRQDRPGVLYATGNVDQIRMAKADGEACLSKPYLPADVIRALQLVEQIVTTGEASKPFPVGFHVLEQSATCDTERDSRRRQSARDIKRLLRQQAALAEFGSFAFGEDDVGKVLMEGTRICVDGSEGWFSNVRRKSANANEFLPMPSFGIAKPAGSGSQVWLTTAFPFLTWGKQSDAARYATREEAWQVIGGLSPRDGAGAQVIFWDDW